MAAMNGRTRSAKSPGMSGSQEITTVRPKPAIIAARVLRAETVRPSRRMIRMGPKAEPAAENANSTREKISARQNMARTVARIRIATTVVRDPAQASMVSIGCQVPVVRDGR